jgi:hypothetical protein
MAKHTSHPPRKYILKRRGILILICRFFNFLKVGFLENIITAFFSIWILNHETFWTNLEFV